MSLLLALLAVLFSGPAFAADALAPAVPVPILTVADSINPGSGNYIIQGIQEAEKRGSPYVILQLDTPGGLLHTTRQIVQEMLNARIPIVVFIGPRGAQAGSAGAIITFGADVAVMAPGTNIGAAHPVLANGEKADETMRVKMENDTAAFAESLARAKGRNAEWAVRAVKQSASIPADEAVKTGVIDFIADDLPDLTKKLAGLKLKMPKHGVAALPAEAAITIPLPMTVKQRVVSFFADPNLAYLVMALGGLCLWIELTHPGIIFPGVLGTLCVIVSLISFQLLPIDYGALALLIVGMGMLVLELFVPAYGALGLGGIACFIFGSLFLMDTGVPELRISLALILPTAAVLAAFICLLGVLVWRARRLKPYSGMEAMVGEFGEVRDSLSGRRGKVFVRGELWNAVSGDESEIPKGALVVVKETRDMYLVVERRPGRDKETS